MIEIRQLKYFICVAELEHFGQASAVLHVVQPALTRQIKQLEEELDTELFERLPRGVKLTPAGRVLLNRARLLMDEYERMALATRQAGQGKTGFVRVGFSDGATYSGHVPEIVREFRAHYPMVELELIPASSKAQGEMLSRESIDIGFVYWLPKDLQNVHHLEINHERVVLAVAESNKLARQKSVTLAQLKDRPFVWFKRANAPGFYDLIASRCNPLGLQLNVVQEAFTESTMLSLVAADMGVTFITEAARRRKPENVVMVEVKDLDATLKLTAMWRANDSSPALKQFLRTVKTASKSRK